MKLLGVLAAGLVAGAAAVLGYQLWEERTRSRRNWDWAQDQPTMKGKAQ